MLTDAIQLAVFLVTCGSALFLAVDTAVNGWWL